MPIVIFETIECSEWDLQTGSMFGCTSQELCTAALFGSMPRIVAQATISEQGVATITPEMVKVVPKQLPANTLNAESINIILQIGQAFAEGRDELRDELWDLCFTQVSGWLEAEKPSFSVEVQIMNWCGRISDERGNVVTW